MSDVAVVQQKVLEILKQFIEICEQEGLAYYALGGTLLGAVRHQGFIPWDDDIDIGMPRADYERFKLIAAKYLKAPYVFLSEDSPGYNKAFSVIRDSSTKILMTYSQVAQEESLWIDIFPLDGAPIGGWARFVQEKRYLYRRMKVQLSQFSHLVNQKKANRPFIERAIIGLANKLHVERWISFDKAQAKYIKAIKKYDLSAGAGGNYTGAYKLRELVPSDYFGQAAELPFEDISIRVPAKYHEYLVAIYGDNYMELPPVDKQVPHQYQIITLGE